MRNSISQVYVVVDDADVNRILGYMSLTPRKPTPADQLPRDVQKKLPREVPGYTLGRLAVAIDAQRCGHGRRLLIHAMAIVKHAARAVGGWGMFIDAKDNHAAHYYEQFGFVRLPSNPLTLYMPVADLPG
jgi:predicted GNAT family N-acyltransferase